MRRDNPDRNAKDILENLEADGWTVCRISRAVEKKKGVPDAIVARHPARKTHLVEIKSLGGKLTPEQFDFATMWPSCVHVISSSWEGLILLAECEARDAKR